MKELRRVSEKLAKSYKELVKKAKRQQRVSEELQNVTKSQLKVGNRFKISGFPLSQNLTFSQLSCKKSCSAEGETTSENHGTELRKSFKSHLKIT